MLVYNFGYWWEWLDPQKVTFDGLNKLIIVNEGETSIDVQIDMYSAWKEWVRAYDNSKWLPAFRTFGGDPTGENQFAPRYFFLLNNWKVLVSNMSIVVQMNLYSDDGSSPFIINNAAVTNRASDVPVIQSEVERRLEYGDRVYYDETSPYFGTDYPNGTIAQPVNDIMDAIAIAQLYNITSFYVLSDITLPGISDVTFDGYSIYANRENLTMNIIGRNIIFNNINWNKFTIDAEFGGGDNIFENCIIINAYDVSGVMKNCQIFGIIRIYDTLVTQLCYSGIPGSLTPTYDMNVNRTTRFSLRSYSGEVKLLNVNNSGDTATFELIAGQVRLDSSCTSGFVNIGGVCEVIDNSGTGCTVINQAISRQTIEDSTWDATITEHIDVGSTGYALYNVSAGATPEVIADAVWRMSVSGFTGDTAGHYLYDTSTKSNLLTGITEQITSVESELISQRVFTYDNVIYYDPSGFTGTTYPIGTHIYPVNNLEDLLVLSNDLNIKNIIVRDSLTINSAITMLEYKFTAESIETPIEINGNLQKCEFIGFTVDNSNFRGNINKLYNCIVNNISNFKGYINDSLLVGEISVKEKTFIINSYSDWNNSLTPKIILSNVGDTINVRNYSGELIFDNINDVNDTVIIDILSGRIIIESGCTDGDMEIRGIGSLENNSTGTNVISNLITPESQEIILTAVQDIEVKIRRILGLTQENFRVIDQVYDSNNLLTSSTIKIYNSSSDCNNDVNPLATYSMVAVYDGDGKLTNYKVIKN